MSKPVPVPAGPAGQTAVDDLTRIDGIGPGIAGRLDTAGIKTFARLAASTPATLALLVSDVIGMSEEQIIKQDWIGQAGRLASESASSGSERQAASSGNRQHYATFTIELELDPDNNVCRTRVKCIPDGEETAWDSWEEQRMIAFIAQHAALQPTAAAPIPTADQAAGPAAATGPVPATPTLKGALGLRALEVPSAGVMGSHGAVSHGEPFPVRVTLDLAGVEAQADRPLDYTVAVYAKGLAGGAYQAVGETQGTIVRHDPLALVVDGQSLPKGVYRLESVATLNLPGDKHGLATHLKGGILQVY